MIKEQFLVQGLCKLIFFSLQNAKCNSRAGFIVLTFLVKL